jgi:hypothetical protein
MTALSLIDARAPVWPSGPASKTGIAYVGTGLKFVDEARQSAARLKLHNPKLSICLITDQINYHPVFWDDIVIVEHAQHGFRDKILMGLCPYERFLYLDTDTFVAGDLDPVFTLLEKFDFAGHQLFEGNDCPLPNVSSAFNEFNGGVLGFRRSPVLNGFFQRWMDHYDVFFALNRDGHHHYSNVSDQKSLRLAVYESALRVAVLKPEYNFTPHHLDFACDSVRILHGRGQSKLTDLEKRLNAKLGNRAYIPRFDVVVHDDTSGAELRRLWCMSTLQLLRHAGRAFTPISLRNRLRQSSLIRSLFLRNKFSEAKTAPDPKWREPGSIP